MTQNATLIFDSLFLHDTHMTDLEREQTALRKTFLAMTATDARSQTAAETFNFAPPFCPVAQDLKFEGKLTIGAPTAVNGWIMRPVSASNGASLRMTAPIGIPGWPPLPEGPGFILGYAGNHADELVGRTASSAAETQATVQKAFTVSARYRATMTLEIAYEEDVSFSCGWTVGPARWEKA